MPKQPNRKLIGLFMIVGIMALIGILIYLMQNKIFANKGSEVVMFFEESITGLSVGSPVVLKGVKIGEVSKISIKADPADLTFSIPVYARMHAKSLLKTKDYNSGREVLDALVDKGLRARLISQSYVTGQLMIDLVMLPGTPIKYHGVQKVLEIPTALSPFGELSRGLQELPLQEGVRNFAEFFKGLNHSMPDINRIIADVEKIVNRNKGASTEVLNNFNQAIISVMNAARSMQNLTDYLERHPEAIIKGKK